MLRRIKIVMIVLILIIAILLGIIVLINKGQDKVNNTTLKNETKEETKSEVEVDEKIKKLEDVNRIIQLSDCAKEYLNAVTYKEGKAFELLDANYAKKSGINKENIIDKLYISDKFKEFEVKSIYMYEKDVSNIIYYVYGNIIEKDIDKQSKDEIELIIHVNFSDLTYSIIPFETGTLNYETYDVGEIAVIEKNANNTFMMGIKNEKLIVLELFNKYILNVRYAITDSYNLLEQSYREKRFGSLENYYAYMREVYTHFSSVKLEKYQVVKQDKYDQYICIDNYGNYYIFNVTAPMEYSVMLDTYTVPQDEFYEKYNKGSDEVKVGMNAEKFIEMINTKDYQAAYSVLARGFKENYFPTLESFEEYVKSHFYQYNIIGHGSFSNEGGVYIHKITISNQQDGNSVTVEKNIIVKLGSGIDFEMSFNV